MKYSYFFRKICYLLFNDYKIQKIQSILNCEIIGEHGFYYPRFTSYLIKDNLDLNRLNQLENVLKCHCEIKYENYRYVLKCYRYDLPAFIPFCYKPSDMICLGESYDGKLKISFKEYTNMIIGGTTGSGKSNLIASILLNLNCECIYIDNKGGSDNPLLDYIEVITSIECGIDKLYEISNLIECRLQQLRENKKANLKRIVVVIDELYPYLLRKDKKEIYSLIGLMLSRCRVAKVNFILCSQRLTTEIIPSLITANIDVRIAMRTASAQESINIIGINDAFHINQVGIGIVNLNGNLKTFKAYYVNENEIDNYISKQDKNISIENDTIAHVVEYNENKEIIYFD